MPTIDPRVRFFISLLVTAAIGVTQGTLNLTGAIPIDWIKPVTAWCGIIAFFGSAVLTALAGAGTTTANRIASAAAVVGVKRIDVTPEIAPQVTDQAKQDAQIVTVAR